MTEHLVEHLVEHDEPMQLVSRLLHGKLGVADDGHTAIVPLAHPVVDDPQRPQRPRLVASALIEVEVPRALRRSEPAVLGAVAATIA